MKPIITMLEEIRLYIMQRLVAMNNLAFSLEDTITPSIRKREWIVFPSRFQELVVRKGDQSYSVSLQHKGHNKTSCKKDPQPKPEVEKKPPGRNKQVFVGQCASRGGDRSSRGDGNDGSGSGSGVNDGSGSGVNDGSGSGVNAGSGSGVTDGNGSGGRGGGIDGGRAGGRGKRGGGRAGRGSERGTRGGVFLSSSSCGILTAEHEYQLELDEQAYREYMEEEAKAQAKIDAKQAKIDKERREEHEWEEKNDYFNPANWQEESMEEAPMN
ncbi:hypothetical protein Tco_1077484 [Tanacetum coccineum]